MHHAYSRSPKIIKNLVHAQHCGMILYPGMLACFSTDHSLHFAGEQDKSGLHCKHEVSNQHLLHFTVDSGCVLVILVVVVVLSFVRLSQYANMLTILRQYIISCEYTYRDNIVILVYHPTLNCQHTYYMHSSSIVGMVDRHGQLKRLCSLSTHTTLVVILS